MRSLLRLAACLVAASAATLTASATPITGSFSLVSFSGSYVNGTAADATGLDFGAVLSGTGNGYGTNGTALVGNATGSFAGLNGVLASTSDVSLGATANPYVASPFISFGTNSGITVNFSDAAYTRSPLGTSLTLTGTALFDDGTPADASTGMFSLATSSQNGMADSVDFTFTSNGSVTSTPAAVTPEPSSFALLGTGLFGFAGIVRRRLA